MISDFLALFGLTSLRQLHAATAQAAELKARAAALQERLESTRQDSERWKQKSQQTATRLVSANKETERWKQKDAGHLAELSRLGRAEKLNKLAREHLLLMETKLDVMEGALTVLDRRTRSQIEPSKPATTEPTADTRRD